MLSAPQIEYSWHNIHRRRTKECRWVGVWQSAPSGVPSDLHEIDDLSYAPVSVQGTLRYKVRIAQGGIALRLRLSNEYRDDALEIGAASIGVLDKGFDAKAGSLVPLRFSGQSGMVVPGGAPAVSDPVDLHFNAQADLLVSLFLKAPARQLAIDTREDVRVAIGGEDQTLTEHMHNLQTIAARPIASAIHVLREQRTPVIAVLGDSIVEGQIDPLSGNQGWPGFLSERLAAESVSVVNTGISGNRLLVSESLRGRCALARLDQDVFSIPGLTHLVVSEGVNDIGRSGSQSGESYVPLVDPSALITALRQIIARAHLYSVPVIGTTLLPFADSDYDRVDRERVRARVNRWVRESEEFDAVIDFDSIMADPEKPTRLRSEYDSGDHFHPSIEGHKAMANAFHRAFFRARKDQPGGSALDF